MPARTIPQEPSFRTTGEERLWALLRDQLPDDAVLLPGLRLSNRGEDREADLVVGWPGVGVAVLEVKGGHISRGGGQWRQTHADGRVSIVHPVDQARTCKYLLRDYLRADRRWGHRPLRMAHMVVFPATSIPADFDAPDCGRWRILDRADLANAAQGIRNALCALIGQPEPPTAQEVETLATCLSGTLLPQRDLARRRAIDVEDAVADREYACDLLTSAQAKVLDCTRLMKRIEVLGGAGSGKTWLAVEQARRLSAQGLKVALVCYSRGLAAYLRRRAATLRPSERPAYVGTFHGLGVEWLGTPTASDDDSEFWERWLPREMAQRAADRDAEDRFDAFVVDEAQDFADLWWPALLAAMKDEATSGLYVFSDEDQRVFARQGRPPVALNPVMLDENLRNTKQIARTFGSLTRLQMKYRGGDGVPVRFVGCPTPDALDAGDDAVEALLAQGWAPEHLALLTTGRRHPEQVNRQRAGPQSYWETFWDAEDVFYGHVLGFKGLERPAVVLVLNGFRDLERAPEMLYVGMSRARDLLVICGDPAQTRQVGGEAVARRLGIV